MSSAIHPSSSDPPSELPGSSAACVRSHGLVQIARGGHRRAAGANVRARPECRTDRRHRHLHTAEVAVRFAVAASDVVQRDLAATGANDVGDVIEDLTINTGSQNNPDAFTQNFTTGTSNVNLRGLGVSSTLVLVNGRRQTQSAAATDRGENFVDTSSLPPLIAFERIELFKDGATALYGSEAVAGVVNFITRSSFEGFDLGIRRADGRRPSARGPRDQRLYGVGNERTHLLAAFNHLDRDPLTPTTGGSRRRHDDLSQAGNPGSFLVPSLPGKPAFTPSGPPHSTATATASPTSWSRLSACLLFRARSRPCSRTRTAPRSRPRIRRSCRASRLSCRARSAPIPIGLCEFDFGDFYSLVPEETRSAPISSSRMSSAIRSRAKSNSTSRQRGVPQQLAVVSVRGVPDRRRVAPRQPVRQRCAFHRPHHRRRRHRYRKHPRLRYARFAGSLTGTSATCGFGSSAAQFSENDFFVQAPDVLVDRFNPAIRGFGGAGATRQPAPRA